jgi:AbrB family looped-hinge helix DNA binding protein
MKKDVLVRAQSVVSVKGQTVIPKEIRDAVQLREGTKLAWTLRDGTLSVFALPEDPIGAMKGALKDLRFSTADLLAERRADRDREEAEVARLQKKWRHTP